MAEPSKKYVLDSVLLYSSRSTIPVELSNLVSDIDIYEHLDCPFLTAQIAMVDETRLMDRLDLQGAEFVEIKLKPSLLTEPVITKRFVVETITESQKVNQTAEFVVLSLYEDILFKSNYKNVNKVYAGDPIKIISDIAEEFLDKKIVQAGEATFQNRMKVIVPNLDPLKAIAWVKNRMTTADGVPDYIFSTLGLDKLVVNDLLTMLEQEPVNAQKPFMYASTPNIAEEQQIGNNYLPILSYNEGDRENMFEMIKDGVVGADYQFYDAFTSKVSKYNLDYKRDVADALPSTKEKKYNFAEFEIDGEVLNEQPSQRITQIGSAGVFNTGLGSYKSYNEEKDDTDYGKKVIGNVMKAHLLKAPITIKVSGVGFLKPKTNMTLGNTVRIYFMANKPAHAKSTNNWDMKRSGDYLIYATKHSFTTERYDISLTCAKMKNFTSEAAIV
jgi:hypothetical protein